MFKYLSFIFLFFIFYCSENNNPLNYSDKEIMEFKEIAWNDLSQEELSTIIISKEKSNIYYSKISRDNGIYYYTIDDSEYTFIITHPEIDYRTKQTFVIILINTLDDALLGPIIVVVEPSTKKAFGRGTRG